MEAIFQTADKISAAPPRSREEELEARINEQAAEIERRDALIEELRESPLPERASMDNLKQSERLMFLARINDLTLANQALEIEHQKTIKAMQDGIEHLQTNQEILFGLVNKAAQRIAPLERLSIASAARPGAKAEARKNKLDKILLSRRNEPMTFSDIGKLLELGIRSDGNLNTRRQAMTKFSKILLASPDRYEITEGRTRRGKLCRLNKDYYDHLKMVVQKEVVKL